MIAEDMDQRRPGHVAAADARRRQGAHNAAARLAARVKSLPDKDLTTLAELLLHEMGQRGLVDELGGVIDDAIAYSIVGGAL